MNNAASPFVYTSIGTCRLADPLDFLSKTASPNLLRDQRNIYAYTHTAKEAIQQIRFGQGLKIPSKYAPFITGTNTFPALKKRPLPDLVIVEISSLKEVSVDGIQLQLNHFSRQFSKFTDLLQIFLKNSGPSQKAERQNLLRQNPAFRELDQIKRHILDNAVIVHSVQDSMKQDIQEICSLVGGKIVFVPHINVKTQAGGRIWARDGLLGMLGAICSEMNLPLFDNTPLISHFGERIGLLDEGGDVNHYAKNFIPVVATFMLHGLIEPMRNGYPVCSFTDFDLSKLPDRETSEAAMKSQTRRSKAAVSSHAKSGVRLVSDVRGLINERKHAQAHDMLRPACRDLETTPREVLVLFGRTAAAAGSNEEKRALGNALLTRFPTDLRALVTALQCFTTLADDPGMCTTLERIVELHPNDGSYLKRLSVVQQKLGDVPASIRSGILAAEQGALNVKRVTTLVDLAAGLPDPEMLARLGELGAALDKNIAVRALRKLRAFDRPDLSARVVLALPEEQREKTHVTSLVRSLRSYCSQMVAEGRFAAALRSAQTMTSLEPVSGKREIGRIIRATRDGARHAVAGGDFTRALQALHEALTEQPMEDLLLKELAISAQKGKFWSAATRAWLVLDSKYGGGEFLEKAAQSARQGRDWAVAVRLLGRLVDARPSDLGARDLLDWSCRKAIVAARELVREGKLKDAAEIVVAVQSSRRQLDKVAALSRDICKKLSDLLTSVDLTEAKGAADVVLQLRPEHPQALKVEALSLEKANSKLEAAEMWERLASGASGRPTHWQRAARLFGAAGDMSRASHARLQAQKSTPQNVIAN